MSAENERTGHESARPSLDTRAVRRANDRAVLVGGPLRVLGGEIAGRMAARLDFVRLTPRTILDAGCGLAPEQRLFAERYPGARVIGVDSSIAALRNVHRRESLWQKSLRAMGRGGVQCVGSDLGSLALADSSIDLIWSNLALASASDEAAVLKEFYRVLGNGGLLMFSTYGPDTLRELRAAFAAVGEHRRVHEFTDMHDLGDMLVASGFSQPVMDMDRMVLTYRDVDSMAREIRMEGCTNARTDRRRGMTGRALWSAMQQAYASRQQDNRIEASIEIVYGHAWKATPEKRDANSPRDFAPIRWQLRPGAAK